MIQISDCQAAAELVCDYAENKLPARERKLMSEHVRVCRACHDAVTRYSEVADLMRISARIRTGEKEPVGAAWPGVQFDVAPAPSGALSRLGSAPWWFVSLALHLLVILLASLISMSIELPKTDDGVIMVTELQARPDSQREKEEQKKPELRDALENHGVAAIDPTSKEASDVVVPPDILAKAELSDHFETINPDLPDTHSALGNPDAKSFHSIQGNTGVAGGGGTSGMSMEDVIGVGGAASKGSGGGFGGGDGTGIGIGKGAGAGSFGQRNGAGRRLLVKRNGGNRATESAVNKALEWLAYHQEPDGHWDIKKYEGGGSVAGGIAGDCGVSAIATLAFLGAGHTSKIGNYKDNVKLAVDWLIKQQQGDGNFGNSDHYGPEYNSALSTLALAENFAMTKDPVCGDAAQKGIDYVEKIQNEAGGWAHSNGGYRSTSVVGWAVMALKSAKIAGLKTKPESFERALKYFDKAAEKDADGYWGKVYYNENRGLSYNKQITTTAVGMVCLEFMGQGHETEQQAELIVQHPPEWKVNTDIESDNPQNFYHWYYSTLGLFQHGGDLWKKWNAGLIQALVPNQRKDGDMNGSWNPCTGWDAAGGRVYTTAMGALCLEVYYRYLQLRAEK